MLRQLGKCTCGPVSPWALEYLLTVCEKHEANAATQFYHTLSMFPWAGSIRGYVFERQVLKYLDDIKEERHLKIRRLTETKTGKTSSWIYRGKIERFTFKDSEEFQEEFQKRVATKKPVHLVPSAPNFAAVDSIVYHPNDVLTLIQVTRNKSAHPIAVSGLRLIQSWVQEVWKASLATKKTPWRFLFIVPLKQVPTFKLQKLEDDTEKGEWAGKMNQYVFGLELKV